jgi:hypothetical protein
VKIIERFSAAHTELVPEEVRQKLAAVVQKTGSNQSLPPPPPDSNK